MINFQQNSQTKLFKMEKVKIVKEHFDNTGNYLNNNLVIEYRTLVV